MLESHLVTSQVSYLVTMLRSHEVQTKNIQTTVKRAGGESLLAVEKEKG